MPQAQKMNKTQEYKLTIVVPVYNERDNMANLEQRLSSYIASAPNKSCVLFVNDGSKDDSLRLIEEACSRHEGFFFISLAKNSGLSAAMKAGIDTASLHTLATLTPICRQPPRILTSSWNT